MQKDLHRKWLTGDIGSIMSEEERKALIVIGVDFSSPLQHSSFQYSSSIAQTASGVTFTSTSSAAVPPLSKNGKWETKLSLLKAYKASYGHCNVPRTSKQNPQYNSLGEWVHFQRRQHNKFIAGSNCTLTSQRKQYLDEIGFEWRRRGTTSLSTPTSGLVSTVDLAIVEQNMTPIGGLVSTGDLAIGKQNMKEAEITSNPPQTTPARDEQESSESPRKKRSVPVASDDSNKKARLKEDIWSQNLEKVAVYKQRFGNCNIPRKWAENMPLGEWVHFQRRQYRLWTLGKKNHMTGERVHKLSNLGFEWSRNLSRPLASNHAPAVAIVEGTIEAVPEPVTISNGGDATEVEGTVPEQKITISNGGDSTGV